MSSSQIVVTADNRGPLLNLASWLTLSLMCLSTITKTGSKFGRIRQLEKDDFFIIAATVLKLSFMTLLLSSQRHTNVIAVSEQVKSGLGQHVNSLTSFQTDAVQKAAYSAQMLYIISLCFAKLALLQVYTGFARDRRRLRMVRGVMTLNLLWALIALFSIAFQCQLPRPWSIFKPNQCFNQLAFWTAIGVLDVFVDLTITIIPIWFLRDLQLPPLKKTYIILAFDARTLVIPLAILRLVYIYSAAQSTDLTFVQFNTVMATVIHVNLSIILATVPFLKPFVDSLQIGLFNTDSRILVPAQNGRGTVNRFNLNTWSRNRTLVASNRPNHGSQQWYKLKSKNTSSLPGALTDM